MRTPRSLLAGAVLIALLTACKLPFSIATQQPPADPNAVATLALPTLSPGMTPVPPTQTPIVTTPAAPTDEAKTIDLRFGAPDGMTPLVISEPTGWPSELRRGIWIVPTGYEGMNDCSAFSGLGFSLTPDTEVVIPGDPYIGSAFHTCGWVTGENVTLELTRPDGTVDTKTVASDEYFGVTGYYQFGYDSLLGEYQLKFSGASGQLVHTFRVVEPVLPGMVYAGDNRAYFYNLTPGERVVVGAYTHMQDQGYYKLTGWGVYYADAEGRLYVQDDTHSGYMMGRGESSGILRGHLLMDLFFDYAAPFTVPGCTGAPASRLSASGLTRVTLGGGPNNLRREPSLSSALVGQANPGEQMIITHDQPVCADGMLWWNVWKLNSPGAGWTSEGQGGSYWLEPAD